MACSFWDGTRHTIAVCGIQLNSPRFDAIQNNLIVLCDKCVVAVWVVLYHVSTVDGDGDEGKVKEEEKVVTMVWCETYINARFIII